MHEPSYSQSSQTRPAHSPPVAVPGPRGLPLLGSLLPVWRDPLQMFLSGSQRYGEVFQFKLATQPFFFVAHPAGVQHLLQDAHRNYAHWPQANPLHRALLGQGLLTSTGDTWRRHHTLA
jgi:hypothetical protein